MSVANMELFEQSLQALQHIPLQAALVTDHEGVVLLRAGELADDASLQRMAANYAQTTEQNSAKLRLGKNRLVTAIRAVALANGWAFDPATFDDKKIRDRIRCFFKTHIQNAKKRLKTVVKNEHKKSNRLLVLAAKEVRRGGSEASGKEEGFDDDI